ncbi:MAG: hypothetical protein MI922_11905 [Bacteroidales bacterium]|nr:hypothetical protein [Bacteroidales bacterium]
MTLNELNTIINGNILYSGGSGQLEDNLLACASDLMSDVLTLGDHKMILVTGLNNPQSIRTAEIADIATVIFVRNKVPSKEMQEIAKGAGINLIVSEKSMFHVSGLLYNAGIKPVY